MKEISNEAIIEMIVMVEDRLDQLSCKDDNVDILQSIATNLREILATEHDGKVYVKDCKR